MDKDEGKYERYDVYDFLLDGGAAGNADVEIRRYDEEKGDVHTAYLAYRESANTRVQLTLVIALANNEVDLKGALHLKAEVADARATKAAEKDIHENGGVMIQRLVKFDEGATDADVRRTKGLTMRILGTLLELLVQIGMCGADTRVYVYPGVLNPDGTRRKLAASDAEAAEGLEALVGYYRRSSFEMLAGGSGAASTSGGVGIMVTRVRSLVELHWPGP